MRQTTTNKKAAVDTNILIYQHDVENKLRIINPFL